MAKASNQHRDSQVGGGQVTGKSPDKNRLHQPPNFQGKSGQSDNQSTSRGKGKT